MTDGRKKIRAATPSQIQLCSRDMTADVITVDIASRNLAGRRDCCADFFYVRNTRITIALSSYRMGSVDPGLLREKSNFVEPARFSLRNAPCDVNLRKGKGPLIEYSSEQLTVCSFV